MAIRPAADAVVPVYDHGFLYGEGIYEVVRTYNGKIFLYDYHTRRLRQSAHYINLDVPFDDETLLKWIEQTRAAAGDMREAYIRILLTRGIGELTAAARIVHGALLPEDGALLPPPWVPWSERSISASRGPPRPSLVRFACSSSARSRSTVRVASPSRASIRC